MLSTCNISCVPPGCPGLPRHLGGLTCLPGLCPHGAHNLGIATCKWHLSLVELRGIQPSSCSVGTSVKEGESRWADTCYSTSGGWCEMKKKAVPWQRRGHVCEVGQDMENCSEQMLGVNGLILTGILVLVQHTYTQIMLWSINVTVPTRIPLGYLGTEDLALETHLQHSVVMQFSPSEDREATLARGTFSQQAFNCL